MKEGAKMTCEDCIHYNICTFHLTGNENEKCMQFLDKADVVEVVRCKDCKYYKLYHLACVYPHHNGVISVDGFCSYGERKEQE